MWNKNVLLNFANINCIQVLWKLIILNLLRIEEISSFIGVGKTQGMFYGNVKSEQS